MRPLFERSWCCCFLEQPCFCSSFISEKDLTFVVIFLCLLQCIDSARDILDTDLTAMVGESYNRAYGVSGVMVSVVNIIAHFSPCPAVFFSLESFFVFAAFFLLKQLTVKMCLVILCGFVLFSQGMVSVQMLSELEEVLQYKLHPDRTKVIRQIWWDRLQVNHLPIIL